MGLGRSRIAGGNSRISSSRCSFRFPCRNHGRVSDPREKAAARSRAAAWRWPPAPHGESARYRAVVEASEGKNDASHRLSYDTRPCGGFSAGAAWPPSKITLGNSFLTENNSLHTDFYRQTAAGNRNLPETTEDNKRQQIFTVSPRHRGPNTGEWNIKGSAYASP